MSGYYSLTGGILFDKYEKVRSNFYEKIDEKIHASTYVGEHCLYYAEPEFTGKFMDMCAHFYERDGDVRALEKGMAVVQSIAQNIRADGYIGMLGKGNELLAFSVWNQSFTLYGLTRMYAVTQSSEIKSLIEKVADWIFDTFSGENPPDILEASNKGSENITCFFAMLSAYEATENKKYLEFVERIIEYCERTDMNLLSFESILALRSQKGIEMIVVYLGVLKYGILAKNPKAVDSARRYFEELRLTQIRNTGNGTIRESWTENGNAPRLMATEEKPNETCVAVGIIELALSLFYVFPEAKYLDVIEKTLFNHMCASLEKSGSDLAYYQGNWGKKVYRTAGGAYQCCRYRGFTLFSYLNDMLYRFDSDTLIPMIYTASVFEGDGVICKQVTDYPALGEIIFDIKTERSLKIKLRVPEWCDSYTLTVDGKRADAVCENQYLTLDLRSGEHKLTLFLLEKPIIRNHQIDGKEYLSVSYGPMLMTHDTHFGGEIWQSLSEKTVFERAQTSDEAVIKLCSKDMTLVDFASAGGADTEKDLYTVFIPRK